MVQRVGFWMQDLCRHIKGLGIIGGGFPKSGVPMVTIMENQMEKKMENEMETGII